MDLQTGSCYSREYALIAHMVRVQRKHARVWRGIVIKTPTLLMQKRLIQQSGEPALWNHHRGGYISYNWRQYLHSLQRVVGPTL